MQIEARVLGTQEVIAKVHHVKRSLLSRRIMGEMSAKAVTMIKLRTEKGTDVNGARFKDYSIKPAYIRSSNRKHSKFYLNGYRGFKATRGGGWLHDSGRMLSAMQSKVLGRDRAVIRFTRTEEALKAHGHNSGSKTLPQRKFFGLNKKDRQTLTDILRKEINNAVAS